MKTRSALASLPVTLLFLSVGQALIPRVKEESLTYLLIKFFLKFFMIIAIFKHIFELRWGLQNALHILVCHSVTPWWNPDYHTPISRGYPEVSYGPNSLNISGVIRELELGETFR